jgi:hypothetical protein
MAHKSLILRNFLSQSVQSYAITTAKQLAMPVVATAIVVDAIAVANGEAVPGTIPPDRVLHEPGKRRREGRIELASVNVRREQTENAGAPSRPVAPISVGMVGAQPPQDPGSVQETMDQGVDGHEGCADSTHSGRRLPALSSSDDNVIAKTLSATP